MKSFTKWEGRKTRLDKQDRHMFVRIAGNKTYLNNQTETSETSWSQFVIIVGN